ncbi:MAG: hypothetical protein FJY76_00030 [Candidatus Aenigmarchaeota archaeon]|nr:hypothetical protein [Candidatus Aenigmarchaeota archaeon]
MKTIAAIAVMAFVLLAFFAGGLFSPKTVLVYNSTDSLRYQDISGAEGMTATVIVPAVDEEGNGVATLLVVQAKPGSGNTLVNIDRLIFWADTQDSIRTAKSVAQKYTGVNASAYDIIYSIRANASVVEGPSAGGALAVVTIAALEGKQPNQSVMVTGTINPDGSIGPIGEALAKARAAKQIGAQLFLVPLGQSVEVKYESQKTCRMFGASEVCRVETVPRRTNIAEAAGIDIIEVSTIGDAVRYFMV